MATRLTKDEMRLIREIAEAYCPHLIGVINSDVFKMQDDKRMELMSAAITDLQSRGFGPGWEPNERGRALEDLIGKLNRPNLET